MLIEKVQLVVRVSFLSVNKFSISSSEDNGSCVMLNFEMKSNVDEIVRLVVRFAFLSVLKNLMLTNLFVEKTRPTQSGLTKTNTQFDRTKLKGIHSTRVFVR